MCPKAQTLTLLVMRQGTFVECAAPAPVTAPLAAAVLELLCAPAVHAHPQPFVRRSALVAASQVGACEGPQGVGC